MTGALDSFTELIPDSAEASVGAFAVGCAGGDGVAGRGCGVEVGAMPFARREV